MRLNKKLLNKKIVGAMLLAGMVNPISSQADPLFDGSAVGAFLADYMALTMKNPVVDSDGAIVYHMDPTDVCNLFRSSPTSPPEDETLCADLAANFEIKQVVFAEAPNAVGIVTWSYASHPMLSFAYAPAIKRLDSDLDNYKSATSAMMTRMGDDPAALLASIPDGAIRFTITHPSSGKTKFEIKTPRAIDADSTLGFYAAQNNSIEFQTEVGSNVLGVKMNLDGFHVSLPGNMTYLDYLYPLATSVKYNLTTLNGLLQVNLATEVFSFQDLNMNVMLQPDGVNGTQFLSTVVPNMGVSYNYGNQTYSSTTAVNLDINVFAEALSGGLKVGAYLLKHDTNAHYAANIGGQPSFDLDFKHFVLSGPSDALVAAGLDVPASKPFALTADNISGGVSWDLSSDYTFLLDEFKLNAFDISVDSVSNLTMNNISGSFDGSIVTTSTGGGNIALGANSFAMNVVDAMGIPYLSDYLAVGNYTLINGAGTTIVTSMSGTESTLAYNLVNFSASGAYGADPLSFAMNATGTVFYDSALTDAMNFLSGSIGVGSASLGADSISWNQTLPTAVSIYGGLAATTGVGMSAATVITLNHNITSYMALGAGSAVIDVDANTRHDLMFDITTGGESLALDGATYWDMFTGVAPTLVCGTGVTRCSATLTH